MTLTIPEPNQTVSESEIKRVKQRQKTNESSKQRLDRQRRLALWCSRKDPNKGRCSIVTGTKRRSVLFTSRAHMDIPGVHQHGNLMLAPSLAVESKRRVSFHPLAHFSKLFYLQRHPHPTPPHPHRHTYIHFVCPSCLLREEKEASITHLIILSLPPLLIFSGSPPPWSLLSTHTHTYLNKGSGPKASVSPPLRHSSPLIAWTLNIKDLIGAFQRNEEN